MPGQSHQRINPSREEDRNLLSQCLTGNKEAAEMFVRRFSDLIYRSIQHILIIKNVPYTNEDLKDMHNSIFLELFDKQGKKLKQYEGKNGCSLATWIRTITVRTLLNHLRKKEVDGLREKKRLIPIENLPELTDDKAQVWELLESSHQETLIRNSLQTLPPRDRLLLKLHIDQELPLSEVAEIMNISVQNAYTLKHRIIHKLKTYLVSAEKFESVM